MLKTRLLALLLTIMVALPAFAADKAKVVYHLSDPDKVGFVLNNIRNHIDGVGGPENVRIVLVMHGPVIKSFADIDAVDKTRNAVKQLQGDGVEIDVCTNSLKSFDLTMDEMLPGLVEAKNGGVVRIAEFQGEGSVFFCQAGYTIDRYGHVVTADDRIVGSVKNTDIGDAAGQGQMFDFQALQQALQAGLMKS